VVLLLLIAGGVWALVAQPWASASAAPAPSSSADPATDDEPAEKDEKADDETESPKPTDGETPGIVACTADDVRVTAVADAESYQAGELPKFSISLENTGAEDCTLNVGSSTQSFTVTSGEDVWWRSTDCQEEPSDMIVTLTAGKTVTSAEPVTWDRTRSDVDTCEQENRPRAAGGGASYHVAVSIGGFDSTATTQILLY